MKMKGKMYDTRGRGRERGGDDANLLKIVFIFPPLFAQHCQVKGILMFAFVTFILTITQGGMVRVEKQIHVVTTYQ